MPTGRLAGFRFQRSIELGTIAHKPGQVGTAAQLANQPRGVPCGAVRELQPLEQHDVAHTALGQMVGDAAADDPAADDDDARRCRQVHPLSPPTSVSFRRHEINTASDAGVSPQLSLVKHGA